MPLLTEVHQEITQNLGVKAISVPVHSLAYFQGSFREKQDYAFTAKSSV
jgi:hypothetical protein